MRGGIIDHPHWHFSEAEREDATWSSDEGPPKAADLIGRLGVSLVAALGLALFVCTCLSAAGIPAP